MRPLLLSVVLAACVHSSPPRGVNVAAVRHEIRDAIAASKEPRKITSMGQVTQDQAVVFTVVGTEQREETWHRTPKGWQLQRSERAGVAKPCLNRQICAAN